MDQHSKESSNNEKAAISWKNMANLEAYYSVRSWADVWTSYSTGSLQEFRQTVWF
jgi:hypothetical protein